VLQHRQPHIGLIGCGLWGANIARDLLALECKVTCVDISETGRGNAAKLGIPTAAGLDDLPTVDAVIVATPATTHYEVVSMVLSLGVPVFCEKPLTTDAVSARSLQAQAGDQLFVMHNWRFHPGVQALGTIAGSGELGIVEALKSVRVNWTSPRTDTDSIWTMVPHDLTLAIGILGEIPAPRCARIEYAGDRAVGMAALLGDHPWFSLESSNRYGDKRREIRLHCREGVAVVSSGASTTLEIYRGWEYEPSVEHREVDPTPALRAELKAFLDYLHGGPAPMTTADEGVLVVEQVDVLRSLAERV